MTIEKMMLIVEIAAIVGLVAVNILLFVRRRNAHTRRTIETVQKREQDLNRLLVNHAGERNGDSKLKPYEERYLSGDRGSGTEVGGIKMEILVRTPLSDKKYLTELTDSISIGSDRKNDLVLDSRQAAPKQCMLYRERNKIFIRNVSSSYPVRVVRGHSERMLSDRPLRIQSQDRFQMGDSTVEIRLI